MSNWLYRYRQGFTLGILRRSLRVALFVGTILNLINQGEPARLGAKSGEPLLR